MQQNASKNVKKNKIIKSPLQKILISNKFVSSQILFHKKGNKYNFKKLQMKIKIQMKIKSLYVMIYQFTKQFCFLS